MQLPVRSEDPGFGWFQKKCCESRCNDCGITNRFHAASIAVSTASSAAASSASSDSSTAPVPVAAVPCNCEFDCKDMSGNDIDVVVKVKMYVDQLRSGGFQKEMEEVEMTLPQFKEHFIKCLRKYLVHHYNDIMSSQARRNLYEKMTTDPQLATTIVLASDYSAILDGHSQDQLNQTVQLHSIQLVILLSHLQERVLVTNAYSFWTQQGTSKLKSDNHFYRECKDKAITDAREANVQFDRVIEITDGAPTQFKNRFNVVQLTNLIKKFNLLSAMAVYPPTATFKGEHDGVGNLDKRIIRQAELAETGRYPTTRSYLPLLLEQKQKTPRALNDPDRKTHEIDRHIRMYVTDKPEMIEGDYENPSVLVLDKQNQNYECNNCPGIQGSYNVIAFAQSAESGADNIVYLRDMFCSCDCCRGATKPEDYKNCK